MPSKCAGAFTGSTACTETTHNRNRATRRKLMGKPRGTTNSGHLNRTTLENAKRPVTRLFSLQIQPEQPAQMGVFGRSARAARRIRVLNDSVPPNDGENLIVERARAGDRAAFEDLVRRTSRLV